MNRNLTTLIAVLSLSFLAGACAETVDDGSSAGGTPQRPTASAPASSGGSGLFGGGSSGGLGGSSGGFGGSSASGPATPSVLDAWDWIDDIDCRCHWPEYGYDSYEECYQSVTLAQIDCASAVEAQAGPAFTNGLWCEAEASYNFNNCLADLAGDGVCSDFDAWDFCEEEFEAFTEDCNDWRDEAHEAWLSCFDY